MSDIRGGLQISSASHHQPLFPSLSTGLPPTPSTDASPQVGALFSGEQNFESPQLYLRALLFSFLSLLFGTRRCSLKEGKEDLAILGDLLQMELESLPKELSLLNLDFPC